MRLVSNIGIVDVNRHAHNRLMKMYSFVTWLERFVVACKIYVGMVWKYCGVISICVCMAHFWGFHPYIHTSKMIYHWRGEPERACITDAMFCHGIQTMDNSRTVCCSMSMVSKTLCSHFSGQGSYTLGLNFTISHEMNLWHLWVSLCMTLTWSELNYCAWFDGTRLWAACHCLSWFAVAFISTVRAFSLL